MKSKLMAAVIGIGLVCSIALAAVVAENYVFKGQVDFDNGCIWKIAGTKVTSSAAELNIMDGVTATAAQINLLKSRSPVTSFATTAKMADALMGEYSATRTTATSTWTTVFTGTPTGFVMVDGVISTNVATFTSNQVTIVFGSTGVTYNVFAFGPKSN